MFHMGAVFALEPFPLVHFSLAFLDKESVETKLLWTSVGFSHL